ncbi:MAG: reprolysin-like metallopeptidase [Thermoplasmatota archaeon]
MKWLPYAVAALFLGLALAIDFDGDGWTTYEEFAAGGPFLDGDADDDGLSDGWEDKRGMNPFHRDSDRDGLSDGAEVGLGANPTRGDTDGDGLPDGQESLSDCDDDGAIGILDSDNDADQWLGGADSNDCNGDQDGDGVLDGLERNSACPLIADCDFDGLLDGDETGDYSPLRADSFGVGIPDGVVFAFEQAGQSPSGDDDRDAIPDAWETGGGLLDWGPFSPTPGTRDLLVEYVYVRGPDSGQFNLDFSPAYRAVADMFEAEGIDLQWVETTIQLPNEPYLGFLEAADQAAFLSILEDGLMSDNPYVTSVIMAPQQEQAELGRILGAAQLRSMIAVIDYGSHTTVQLSGGAEGSFSPVLESYIREGNQIGMQSLGYSNSGISGGKYWLSVSGASGYRMEWAPFWFSNGAFVEFNTGGNATLSASGATVNQPNLASTIAHELGHTLGLCHAHEPECYQEFSPFDRNRRDLSTMSYQSASDQLQFLRSEWNQVDVFLACAPETPLTLLAEGADASEVIEDKYRFEGEVLRLCGEFTERDENLAPQAGTVTEPFGAPGKAPRGGAIWFVLYLVAGAVAITATAFVARGRSTSDSEDSSP